MFGTVNVAAHAASEVGKDFSFMHEINATVIPVLSDIIELIGVIIIAVSVLIGLWLLVVKNKFRFNATEKNPILNQGLSVALEILLAAEILKTLVARTASQIVEVGALVLIRILMTILIHWELSEKEKTIKLEEFEEKRKVKEEKRKMKKEVLEGMEREAKI